MKDQKTFSYKVGYYLGCLFERFFTALVLIGQWFLMFKGIQFVLRLDGGEPDIKNLSIAVFVLFVIVEIVENRIALRRLKKKFQVDESD